MDGDLAAQAITTSNSNAQVVLNGAIFNLTSLTGEGDKTDFVADKFDPVSTARLIPEGGVVVDGSLVLSVGDAISVGQVTLGNVSDGSHIDLQSAGIHVTASQLLGHGDLGSEGTTSHLFEVQADTSAGQTLSEVKVDPNGELHLVSQSSVVSPVMVSVGNPRNQPPSVVGLQVVTSTAGVEEPRRRRGGWPKGRKRKKEPLTNAPRAPATAYVLYAIERRLQIKGTTPGIPFVETTKMLGGEWSAMTTEERQKYLDMAEADKKRYIDELKAYQQTEAYKEFLKRKRLKESESGGDDGVEGFSINDLEDEGLYCKVCDQYFSSLHNRKEHIFGRQHLQNMTNEFEKELQKQQEAEGDGIETEALTSDLSHDLLVSSESSLIGASYSHCGESSIGINDFIQDFLAKNYEREVEIRELQKAVESAREKHCQHACQIRELKQIETKLEQDLGTMKSIGASLAAQIDGLRMVPTLFGVINF